MQYNFDELQFRTNTPSLKWNPEFYSKRFHGHTDLLPLWVADMDFKASHGILRRLERVMDDGIFGYTSFDDEYYEAIMQWEQRRHGINCTREEIHHIPSVAPALAYLINSFTCKGDGVIIQSPVYPPFRSSVLDNGRSLVVSPLVETSQGHFVMDYDDFEQKVIKNKVRLFLLCNPHNPGGRVWTKEELEQVATICLRHNVLIVSDEIHCDLTFFGHTYTSLLHLAPEISRQSIVCKSASKTFNIAGAHIAHAIIQNSELRERFQRTANRFFLHGTNIFATEMVKGAFLESDDWYEQMLKYIESNILFASQYCTDHIPTLHMPLQESTYLGFIDARKLGLSPTELEYFCENKAKLAFNYGHWFGKEGEGFLRINLACPQSLVATALTRLKEAILTL